MMKRLLLVDNEETILFAFARYFSRCGFEPHGTLPERYVGRSSPETRTRRSSRPACGDGGGDSEARRGALATRRSLRSAPPLF